MHHKVVLFNLGEVSRVAEARNLEELLQVTANVRQLSHLVARALKVAVVDGIEADEGDKETDIGLRDVIANHVALFA